MSFASNVNEHGGSFFNIVENSFHQATNVQIATGYVGGSIVENFTQQILRIAENGGVVKLLVGMAFYEGFSGQQEDILKELNHNLSLTKQGNGVYISTGGRYHGKIFSFQINNDTKYFVGSSNFSSSGLKTNKELNISVSDENLKKEIQNYLNHLFSSENSVKIDQTKIGSRTYKKRNVKNDYDSLINSLERYDPAKINTESLDFAFSFPLDYSALREKSHLNTYFSKGRLNRLSGIITPRPWYEAELIAPKTIRETNGYPRGDFTAFTDDGFIIPMHTSGQHNKNIQSRGGLQLFGVWIKGKLEKSGALEMFQPFDIDVLKTYGKTDLKFYRMNNIDELSYYLEF